MKVLADHVTDVGKGLDKAVESYNSMVGSMERRLWVTARRFNELQLSNDPISEPAPVTHKPRPLSAELAKAGN